jgi:hypothetical protein
MCRALAPLLLLAIAGATPAVAPPFPPAVRAEAPEEARRRHGRVAERRKGPAVICHRGSSEFAHENTLEAYRATFELGGDGNEIDIRVTRDGVLVCFHDDMLDRLLEAHGDVGDYTWDELRRFPFRAPGRYSTACRIPTLVEVFELHRAYGGLLHLDIKRPGLDRAIIDLLDRMEMWDHIAHVNDENAGRILTHPKLRRGRYKGSLYADRAEVDAKRIAAMLARPGNDVIVDDPRGVVVALGRRLGKVSTGPVRPVVTVARRPGWPHAPVSAALAALRAGDDWSRVAEPPAERAASGRRIRARAVAAEQLLKAGARSPEVLAALEERVVKRSLHRDWIEHGLDGAAALRALILLRAPRAADVARRALWHVDPALAKVANPAYRVPDSWADFRIKMVVFPALEQLPGPATEKLCRDYLALSDAEARRIGPPQFEPAARTLLTVRPGTETALELLRHRRPDVRGRAVLECLRHAKEPWATVALRKAAPHALAYVPPG